MIAADISDIKLVCTMPKLQFYWVEDLKKEMNVPYSRGGFHTFVEIWDVEV